MYLYSNSSKAEKLLSINNVLIMMLNKNKIKRYEMS